MLRQTREKEASRVLRYVYSLSLLTCRLCGNPAEGVGPSFGDGVIVRHRIRRSQTRDSTMSIWGFVMHY